MAAKEIQYAHTAAAANLYVIFRNADGQAYNTAGAVYENYNTANIADYDTAMTEQGTASKFYTAAVPAAAIPWYTAAIYVRAGGAPAEGDTCVTVLRALENAAAHGGASASSTATLAVQKVTVKNPTNDENAITIQATGTGSLGINVSAVGAALQLVSSGGSGVIITSNADGGVGILVNGGPFGTGSQAGPAINLIGGWGGDNPGESAAAGILILGGDSGAATNAAAAGVEIISGVDYGAGGGDGIKVTCASPGHDINLAGDGLISGDFAAFTESYAADGATVKLSQALYEILALLEERNLSGTTLTLKKRDGSTTAFTVTTNSATQPTSTTRAT